MVAKLADADMNDQMQFPVITKETLASTNDFALKLVEEGISEEGTLVHAKHQTQGRGQRSTSWHASPGDSLTFSLICYPNFLKAHRQFYLTQVVALGLVRGFSELTGLEGFVVKWPNDIYFHGQKLGGVLIESSLSKDVIKASVMGIGINLNQIQFPDDLPNPVSLYQITGSQYDSKAVMHQLAKWIWNFYEKLRQGSFEAIKNQYEQALYLLNQRHQFELPEGGSIIGEIRGVDEEGYLKIEQEDGRLRNFDLKEIRF